MKTGKWQGPNGFSVLFYESYSKIVSQRLVAFYNEFKLSKTLSKDILQSQIIMFLESTACCALYYTLLLFTGLGCFSLPGLEVSGVSAAVSDESVAGDSGVYEATTQR